MPTESFKEAMSKRAPIQSTPTASAVLDDGAIVEMVFDRAQRRTRFAVWRAGDCRIEEAVTIDALQRLVPFLPTNNLLVNDVILFPSQPEEYGTDADLIADLQRFIHRYVDVSPKFERLSSYYILFSWLYDRFNELPYLRVRGDAGSGKTRFLLTVGSLCYKPIFASGASSISPLFRILDAVRGTLIIDESDIRVSDEKAEMVKIFNNGNVQGFPVLRSEVSGKGEYNPRAYRVFGPKIVATRGAFDDRALESRFLTEEMGMSKLRRDIPINLPSDQKEEALHLRNRLLLFRFRNLHKPAQVDEAVDWSIEPRLNQIFRPVLSIIADEGVRAEFRALIRDYQRDLVNERGMDPEAQLLEVIQALLAESEGKSPSISAITSRFKELYGHEYEKSITARYVGFLVRRRLGLKPSKRHGIYVIPPEEQSRLVCLYERYGLDAAGAKEGRVDVGDVGDVPGDVCGTTSGREN